MVDCNLSDEYVAELSKAALRSVLAVDTLYCSFEPIYGWYLAVMDGGEFVASLSGV